MKIVKTALFMPAMGFIMGGAMDAGALSKEIAPDVPPEIFEKLLRDAKGYIPDPGSSPGQALIRHPVQFWIPAGVYPILDTGQE